MKNKSLNIVLLEDEKYDAELVIRTLKKADIDIRVRITLDEEEFKGFLKDDLPDIILSDYNLPQYTGLDAIAFVKEEYPLVPIVIVTGSLDEETAAETIKAGAWDYVVKERISRLPTAVRNAISLKQEREAKSNAQKQLNILSSAVEHAPSAIMITDKSGKIEYTNPKFTNLTGYSFIESKGKNPRFLQSGKQSQAFYKELWDTILSGEVWKGEFTNRKKNGEEYWESVSISSVKNDGSEITHFIGLKQDITEKKLANDRLIKALAKAKESDKLKSAFLANISHEIRTPMNAIVGFSNILLNPAYDESKKVNCGTIIKTNCNLLLNIIDNSIDLARLESGEIELKKTKIKIPEFFSSLLESAEKTKKALKKENLNIVFEDLGETIESDPNYLKQIMSNLISNAIKFTDTGSVNVGCKMVGQNKIEFTIKDTGQGISKKDQELIFKRFYRTEETSFNTRGAGLGLSIVKQVVSALNGSINIESEENIGTSVFVTLPIN